MTEITPEELKIYKETFQSLDTNKRGKISLDLIGHALRINNQVPTEAEVKEIIQSYTSEEDGGNIPKIDLEEFCAIMKENSKPKDELFNRLMEAFMVLDKAESGLLEEAFLRETMITLGEPLEEAEVNEMIKDSKASNDGKIAYSDFAKHLATAYSRPGTKKKKGSAAGKKGGAAAGAKKGGKK